MKTTATERVVVPAYVPAETKRVRIGGVECVEMDADKWLGLLQTAEFYTRGKKL